MQISAYIHKDVANVTGNIGPDSRPTPLSPICRSLTTVASDTASRGDPTGHRHDSAAPERGWQTPADDVKIGPPDRRWSMGNMSVGDPEGVDCNQLLIRWLQTALGGPDPSATTGENALNRL